MADQLIGTVEPGGATAASSLSARPTPAGGPEEHPAHRLAGILDRIWDGVSIHGVDGTIIVANEALGEIVGRDAATLRGVAPFTMLHPDDAPRAGDAFRRVAAGTIPTGPAQYRVHRPSGEVRTVECSASNLIDEPGVRGIIVTMRDVTERLLVDAHIEQIALRDSVTGLANRLALEAELRLVADGDDATCLLHIQIDGIDWMTGACGHTVIEATIRALGMRVRQTLGSATVAHLGNGAFGALVRISGGPSVALARADAVARTIARPLHVAAQVIHATTSIGVAFSEAGVASDELLKRAAAAAQHARELGGARVQLFDEQLVHRIERRLTLAHDLRQAVLDKDFRVAFQPIVAVADGRTVGAEVLLRWGRDGRERYAATEIVEMAERTGLIVPLGAWILDAALENLARFGPHLALTLNVNLSVRQLTEPGLVESVADALGRFDVPGRRLAFEVTETLALQDLDLASRVINDIRQLGCRVGVDDFGAGYSSLTHLFNLAIDFIKIDRSFVRSLGVDARSDSLVAAIIAMADALGVSVVAEGVESEVQLARLRRFGCTHAQGYVFARPLPSLADVIERLVEGPVVRQVHPTELTPGMTIASDLVDEDGTLLVRAGAVLTERILQLIHARVQEHRVTGPIVVQVRRGERRQSPDITIQP